MDNYLKRSELEFSIDQICYKSPNLFTVTIIPDVYSKFFPPFHLRHINIRPQLLQRAFLESKVHLGIEVGEPIESVLQGGYYSVPTKILRQREAFNPEIIIDSETDIFRGNIKDSPYHEIDIKGENVINVERISEVLNVAGVSEDKTYLYCFRVGQGDTFLLVTSANNAYLIDTNIYNGEKLETFYEQVTEILEYHKIPSNKLKGLIITHKHLDHIRGAKQIIDSNIFQIEHFILNMDYEHPTKCVKELLKVAKKKIPRWVNLNSPCTIKEGNTYICFKNPDNDTNTAIVAPDINDSSIAMCIRHHNNLMYLTGDASFSVLESKFTCGNLAFGHNTDIKNRMIKIAHHGSETGTSIALLNLLKPKYAYISAGLSKKYNHPHSGVINNLRANNIEVIVSKEQKTNTLYLSNGRRIRSFDI